MIKVCEGSCEPVADPDYLARRITASLKSRLGPRVRELAVYISDEGVELHGCCGSFYHKQLAQEAARQLTEGLRLHNAIEVR